MRDIAEAEFKLEKVEEERNQLQSQLDTVWSQLNDKENQIQIDGLKLEQLQDNVKDLESKLSETQRSTDDATKALGDQLEHVTAELNSARQAQLRDQSDHANQL